MASSYSALKIELITTGEQTGTWGNTTNTNLGTALEEAIVGRATADFPTDANLTLTLTNSNASQVARNFVINLTSSVSLTTTRDLIVPAIEKPYIIQNNTSGSQSVRVIVAGVGYTVPNGKTAFIYNDGTDIKGAVDYLNAPTFSSFTSTGDGTFSGTGQVKLPAGTTGQRTGSPANGMIRYNTTEGSFEGYISGAWGGISGAQANGCIYENNLSITSNYTLTANKNGMSVGPITIASGVSVTVPSGQRWVVL
jgi:hypothetical protein